jgi:hypothetical protein
MQMNSLSSTRSLLKLVVIMSPCWRHRWLIPHSLNMADLPNPSTHTQVLRLLLTEVLPKPNRDTSALDPKVRTISSPQTILAPDFDFKTRHQSRRLRHTTAASRQCHTAQHPTPLTPATRFQLWHHQCSSRHPNPILTHLSSTVPSLHTTTPKN